MRSVWLPSGHIPLREPPCPERQVGEGDALLLMLTTVYNRYQRKSTSDCCLVGVGIAVSLRACGVSEVAASMCLMMKRVWLYMLTGHV